MSTLNQRKFLELFDDGIKKSVISQALEDSRGRGKIMDSLAGSCESVLDFQRTLYRSDKCSASEALATVVIWSDRMTAMMACLDGSEAYDYTTVSDFMGDLRAFEVEIENTPNLTVYDMLKASAERTLPGGR